MIVKKLRLQHGWSQEHLAQISDLSIRTIQRIEQGKKPGLETLNALAAVFNVPITTLQNQPEINDLEHIALLEKIQKIKNFYVQLTTYGAVITLLFIINFVTNPDYLWAIWPALGWGISIVINALNTFKIFSLWGPDWEQKQVKKYQNKNQN